MGKRGDIWLATGLALVSLSGFLVLRPQPAPVVPEASLTPAGISTTATEAPLVDTLAGSVDRVLAEAGNTEIVDPGRLGELPESVVRVLVDRQAVLVLPEEAP